MIFEFSPVMQAFIVYISIRQWKSRHISKYHNTIESVLF